MTDDSKLKNDKPTSETETDPAEGSSEGSRKGDGESVKKLDPTRYGDWEKKGRCIDF